jgi:hypothetical protein
MEVSALGVSEVTSPAIDNSLAMASAPPSEGRITSTFAGAESASIAILNTQPPTFPPENQGAAAG